MRRATGFCFFSLWLLLSYSCKQEKRPVGSHPWPIEIRQNLPYRPPVTCDVVHYKRVSFEISHEQNLDTSLYALVVISKWPLYQGDFQRSFVVDSIPYCKDEVEQLPLICYLVDKETKRSYQFQAKHSYNLWDPSVQKINIKLYAEDIENSGSNMKVSLNNGQWIY